MFKSSGEENLHLTSIILPRPNKKNCASYFDEVSMHLSNSWYLAFSLSTARLQKAESIVRGTGNCPHFYHRQKPMFWLLLSKLLSVSQGFFKATENCMALFFSLTATNLRILWVPPFKKPCIDSCCFLNTCHNIWNNFFSSFFLKWSFLA